jgi:hypothetical protein
MDGQESKRSTRNRAGPGSKQATSRHAPFANYRVLLSQSESGFELAEHKLSNQLLVIFESLPNAKFAGELEALGFDHTEDELMFTLECTAVNREAALRIAYKYRFKGAASSI